MRDFVAQGKRLLGRAFGDWLRNIGVSGGLYGLEQVNRKLLKLRIKYGGVKDYTLDIDDTGIEADR